MDKIKPHLPAGRQGCADGHRFHEYPLTSMRVIESLLLTGDCIGEIRDDLWISGWV